MKRSYLLFIISSLLFIISPSVSAQKYFVSSLATPGAATFNAGQDDEGVISVPFGAGTRTIEVETNQTGGKVTCDADWCQASLEGKTLTLTVTQNEGIDARTATLKVESKDFHPLTLTVRQEARLVFSVISDTHVGNSLGIGWEGKVSQALKNLTGHGPVDLMAVVGDLTDNGWASQYPSFVNAFKSSENIVNPVGRFLFMMGNHDNYDSNGKNNYQQGLASFNGGADYPFHQYVLIKGYPFISISDFAGANNDLTNEQNGSNAYPMDSRNMLEKYLAKAAKDAPGKPIFVFTHVPPRWTCYSAWAEFENNEAWAMKVLNKYLNKYPQVVVFAGHSHYPLGDPRSIHQGANPASEHMNYYTAINTASTNYSEIHPRAVDAGIHPEGYERVTEGMILIEQPNGDIEIRRYDTYRDLEIGADDRWVLRAPFDGSMFQYADIRDANDNPNGVALRDGKPAPVFASGAELKVESTSYDAKVTFPQATDNECVFRYHIRVTTGNAVVKDSYVFSQFYLNTDMPKELSFTVDDLMPETEYSVVVTAYDSWDNISEPLAATFTTPNEDDPANDVPEPKGWWTFDNPSDLLAGSGVATLEGAIIEMGAIATDNNLAGLGIETVEGTKEGDGAVKVPVGSGFKMTTNLEAEQLSSYTLMMDICSTQLTGYTALYQNDPTNQKDGSFYINNAQLGLRSNDLNYNGQLASGKWYRVLFVVKDNVPTIYLDGVKIGKASSANAGHWQMKDACLFFIDDDGEEHVITTTEIRFWDTALSPHHAAKLGNVDGNTEEPDPLPEALGCWTFDNAANRMAGTGTATLSASTHTSSVRPASLEDADITAVDGPAAGNAALHVPVGSSLMMRTNLSATSLSTYSIMWDVMAPDVSDFIPLMQNDLTNAKDGSLFLYQNKVGLNAGNLRYNGNIPNGQWRRILFVVDNNYATVYVDGEKVGSSSSAVAQHWQLSDGALFFADNDGEEKEINVAEIRFWNSALNMTQAEQLGKAGE